MNGLNVSILESPTGGLLLDITPWVRGLKFGTNRHGFASLTCFVPRTLYDSFYLYDRSGVPHVVVSWNGATIWEGRLEDVAATGEGVRLNAIGCWRALSTGKRYTGLWSSTRIDQWRALTVLDKSDAATEKFEANLENGIYIGLKKGETYTTAGDMGDVGYTLPSRSQTDALIVKFTYSFTASTDYTLYLYSSTAANWTGAATLEWSLAGNGANQTATVTHTLTGATPLSLWFQLGATTNNTYAGESGDWFARLTSVRVSSTASGGTATLYADEIADALVAFANAANSTQIQNQTGLIESPGVDLMDEVYQDAQPADILDQLALLGDGLNRWEAGIWENRVLHFRQRASEGRAWYVDASDIDIERTLTTLRNSVYAIYTDASGRILRTASSTDPYSIARYGITYEEAVSVETTDPTLAGLQSDALINDQGNPIPRAGLAFREIYDANSGRWPAFMMRAGDTVTIRNLPPTLSTDVDRIRTFRVAETEYDADTDICTPTPESPLPTLDAQVAQGLNGSSVAGGKTGGVNNKFGKINSDTISGGAVILDSGAGVFADARFLTLALHSDLGAEEVFTPGAGMTGASTGANGTYTVDVVTADTSLTIGANNMNVRLATNSGLQVSSGLQLGTPTTVTTTSTNAVTTTTHSHAIDATIVPATRTITAGAGLTGGGDLSANRTIDVVSGNTGIVANADDITLTLNATSGLEISTGLRIADSIAGAGLTIASKVLAVASANTGIVVNANDVTLTLNATSGLQISTGLMIADTIAGAGLTIASKVLAVVAGAGITVNADDVALAVSGLISATSDNSAAGVAGAVPTVVAGTSVSSSAVGASITLTIPASAVAGEPLMAFVVTRANVVTVTTPRGWALQENRVQTDVTLNAYTRICRTGDASTTWEFAFSGSVNHTGVIVRGVGATSGEFVDIDGSTANAATTTPTIPSVTTEMNDCLVLAVVATAGSVTVAPDATTTELMESKSTDGSLNVTLEIAYYSQVTAGATGTKTVTLSASVASDTAQFSIRPANSGGHQHHIAATWRPAVQSILMTDSAGYLQLADLGTGHFVVRSTTSPQVIVEYDDTNYADIAVDSAGKLTITPTGSLEIAADVTVTGGLNVGTATGAAAGGISATVADALTTTVSSNLIIGHNTSGTAAAGFGIATTYRLETSTTADTDAAYDQITWATATHATRKARRVFQVLDTAARECLRIESSGAAAMVGFLGANAVIRQTVAANATDLATAITLVNDIKAKLGTFGLFN